MRLYKQLISNPVFKNFSFLTIGQVVARFINMFSCIILARWLSPTGYGEYSLYITYVALFGVVASLGMNFIINRVVARDQENARKYLGICLVLRAVGLLMALLILFIYGKIRNDALIDSMFLFIMAGIFFESIWSGLQSIAFGLQKMEWNSIIDVIYSIFVLIIYFSFQLFDPKLLIVRNVILVFLILYFVKDIAYYFVLKKKILLSENQSKINKCDVSSILIQGLPFYVMALVGLFTNQVPIIFLEHHAGLSEVAFFNTANKLLLPITIMLGTFLTALFPNQSILFVKNQDEYWTQIDKMIVILCFSGGVLAFIITLFKDELVLLLFGADYASTGEVLSLQSWYVVLFALFSLNGNALGASDKQKLLSVESIIYAIISTPIIFLSSYQGSTGLSFGYLAASCINIVLLFPILHRVSNKRIKAKNMMFGFIFLVAMFACSYYALRNVSLTLKSIILLILILAVFIILNKFFYGKLRTKTLC